MPIAGDDIDNIVLFYVIIYFAMYVMRLINFQVPDIVMY